MREKNSRNINEDKKSQTSLLDDENVQNQQLEKAASRGQPHSNEQSSEKPVSRQPRAEIQNPLMHESY